MIQDLRFGVRMLLKKPAFTAIAIITFALGIGVNTVVFSVVYLMLFQPLPYPNSDRLAVILQTNQQEVNFGTSYPDFTDWKSQNSSFEQIAAWRIINVNLTSSDPVKHVTGTYISAEFFPLLGGRPQLGRTFLADEFRPGSNRVIILSHSLWKDRFESDAAVIGVLGQGLRLAMIGFAAGLALSLALTRFVSSLLFGVSPVDPATFVAIAMLLASVGRWQVICRRVVR